MIDANPVIGIVLHGVGALSAALCYTPQQKLKGWSWQTFWLVQALVCWLIAPVVGAVITIPELGTVLAEAPVSAMLATFGFGLAYGFGGICFGLAIKHIGYSLTYAIAIGLSCVLGTLTAPIVQRTLSVILDKDGSEWVMSGIAVGIVGIVLCGIAGWSKEADLADGESSGFSFKKGLPLCLAAGVLSALYGIAINDAGAPIAAVAEKHGAGLWQTNVNYLFANPGALVITLFYTLHLARKNKSFREFFHVQDVSTASMVSNYLLSILTGCLWYAQFLFYGVAHVQMGELKFSSWAIHMIMLILFSSSAGLVMREWHGCRRKTLMMIGSAILVLVAAVLVLSYGNYLGAENGY
jgi:L-rhamnose-H+ transport protein